MSDEKNSKSLPEDLEGAQEDREELRRDADDAVLQDLDQGMSTGTHDSTRHGVNWGRAYKKTVPPDTNISKKAEDKK